MHYEWDENKNRANKEKHGVDFQIAVDFDWATAIETYDNRVEYNEDRWIAMGFIGGKLYILVYTERSKNIRIISLRKATKREIKYYEKQA